MINSSYIWNSFLHFLQIFLGYYTYDNQFVVTEPISLET